LVAGAAGSVDSVSRADSGAVGGEEVRDWLAVMLTVGSGSLNAISFLALGKVFTSVITGNLVLLAAGLVKPDHTVVVHAGSAVAGYIAGVIGGATLCGQAHDRQPPWPGRVSAALGLELVLLCALFGGWQASGSQPAGTAQLVLLALGAAAMGVQSSAVNRLAVPGFSSTFLTSTMIRVITELVTGPRENVTIKVAALLSLITGALIGTGLLGAVPGLAPAFPVAVAAGVLLVAELRLRAAG
jgi:uncharacterized membrane protein YoaK (UPF0700 family)